MMNETDPVKQELEDDPKFKHGMEVEVPVKHEGGTDLEHADEALGVNMDQVLEVKLEEEPTPSAYIEDSAGPLKAEVDESIFNEFSGHSMFLPLTAKQECPDTTHWEEPVKEEEEDESSHYVSLADLVKKRKKRPRNLNDPDATDKNFTCELCGYKCNNNTKLTIHNRKHTGEKPFGCKLCDYKCTNKSRLMMHMMTHTGEKPFSCKICDYKCTANYYLVRHMRTHSGEKPYSCKLCDYKCTQHCNLVRHMSTHTSEKIFICETCDCKFADKLSFMYHMRTHNDKIVNAFEDTCKSEDTALKQNESPSKSRRAKFKKPYNCELCDYKCTQHGSLVKHMSTHTSEKIFVCEVCECKFTDNISFTYHMRTHNDNIDNKVEDTCKSEDNSLKQNESSSKSRSGAKLKKPYNCKLCDYKCTQHGNLVRHMSTHTSEKIFLCEVCDCKFTDKLSFTYHMRTHNDNIANTFEDTRTCKSEDTELTQNESFSNLRSGADFKSIQYQGFKKFVYLSQSTSNSQHKYAVQSKDLAEVKQFNCDVCSKTFKRKKFLDAHSKMHSRAESSSSMSNNIINKACELCDFKCTEKSMFSLHMKTHKVKKIFSCSLCDYKCTQYSELVVHKKNHTDKKQLVCHFCDYKCSVDTVLALHMKIHTRLKPFECDVCGCKYTLKSTLHRHMKTHTGEKPYACDICGFKSILKNNLIRHMTIHNGYCETITCKVCDYQFTSRHTFLKHTSTHIGEIS